MKKQKILIFSLSAMLFFSLSFIVYSFTEPTTMPSSYNSPLNTSSTAQTKIGAITVPMVYDYNNTSYYIDPSGNSKLGGDLYIGKDLSIRSIQASGNICLDSGVCLSDIEEFVNNQFLAFGIHTFGQCESVSGTIVDVPGTAVKICKISGSSCPSTWNQYENYCSCAPKTCSGDCSWGSCSSCTIPQKAWSNSPCSTCTYTGKVGQVSSNWTCTTVVTEIGCY